MKKTIKKTNKNMFSIKRKTSKIASSNESLMSKAVKDFRAVAYRMNEGDSIECNQVHRNKIYVYLRYRNLTKNFKSRIADRKKGTINIFCVVKTKKHQLI